MPAGGREGLTMTDHRSLPYDQIRKIQHACCHVFLHDHALEAQKVVEGSTVRLRFPFIEDLTFEEVRKAYRTNVLTYHPDRHQDKSPEELRALSRHLEGVNQAYRFLCSVFGRHAQPCPQPALPRGKVIAVGGAKGGTGKSIFSANLGMLLSWAGYRTAVVDLDLGGSDLHIYMGEKNVPDVTVNDFIHRRVEGLSDAAVKRENRPLLVAGNSAELGIANLPYARKMRLLDKVRALEVDYVILDLGAGTDFNTLDFFLAADYGILVTTLDQPAYLEAYAFMKTALLRRLTRLFGSESKLPSGTSAAIRDLVQRFMQPSCEGPSRTVRELVNAVAMHEPMALPALVDGIMEFTPHLVINRCFDAKEARRIAASITSVARQRLSIDVRFLGTLSKSPVVERCTSWMHHPIVEKQRCSALAAEITAVIEKLGLAF